ncbi:MAG: oligosaccharide flippase family protein [Anaeromyxobacter sp.]
MLTARLRSLLASPLGRRVGGGVLWSLVGGFLGRGAVVLSGIVTARILGKADFGALGVIQNTILMFGVFAGFGMGLTATKFVAEHRQVDPRLAGQCLTLTAIVAMVTGVVATGALWGVGPWLADSMLSAPHLAPALRVSSLVFLFTAVQGALTGALAGFEAFKVTAWVNVWTGLVGLVVNTALVLWAGFDGAVWGLVLASLVGCVATAAAVWREARRASVPLGLSRAAAPWRILLGYSVPAVLSQALVGPVRWMCSVMLVNTASGFAEMGVFNAANQWSQVVLFLSATVSNVTIPSLAERLGRRDHGSSLRVLKGTVAATALVVLPIVIVASLASPLVMRAYGPGFAQGWPTMVVAFATAGLLAVQSPIGNVIQASGRMWPGMVMNLCWGAAYVAFTWLCLPLGALGLALAGLAAYALHGVWTTLYARRIFAEYSALAGSSPAPSSAGVIPR